MGRFSPTVTPRYYFGEEKGAGTHIADTLWDLNAIVDRNRTLRQEREEREFQEAMRASQGFAQLENGPPKVEPPMVGKSRGPGKPQPDPNYEHLAGDWYYTGRPERRAADAAEAERVAAEGRAEKDARRFAGALTGAMPDVDPQTAAFLGRYAPEKGGELVTDRMGRPSEEENRAAYESVVRIPEYAGLPYDPDQNYVELDLEVRERNLEGNWDLRGRAASRTTGVGDEGRKPMSYNDAYDTALEILKEERSTTPGRSSEKGAIEPWEVHELATELMSGEVRRPEPPDASRPVRDLLGSKVFDRWAGALSGRTPGYNPESTIGRAVEGGYRPGDYEGADRMTTPPGADVGTGTYTPAQIQAARNMVQDMTAEEARAELEAAGLPRAFIDEVVSGL